MNNTAHLKDLLSAERLAEIDQWIAKFPADKKQSASLQALRIIQDEHGWLSEQLMVALAEYLDVAPMAIFEVANFYSMYNLQPVGKHTIGLCSSISCMLNGAKDIEHHIEKRLGIKCGETTADGKITLKHVECLGACINAPACNVGRQYHEKLTIETVDKLIDELEQK